jgi:hypothetical protein
MVKHRGGKANKSMEAVRISTPAAGGKEVKFFS